MARDRGIVDYCTMGKRLQVARKTKKMTQQDVAVIAGISTGLVGHIERGLKKPSVDTLAAICRALDVDMHYTVFGQDIKVPKRIVAQAEALIDTLREYIGK